MSDAKEPRGPVLPDAPACEQVIPHQATELIERQADLVHVTALGRHSPPKGRRAVRAEDNAELWRLFVTEHLFDTRRVRLEHFHLFEWFPLKPGMFHTPEGRSYRDTAAQFLKKQDDGQWYYSPLGKLNMLRGGVGAVRLKHRPIGGKDYYFMTASSTGVCHEGFPVLVPRRFFGRVRRRILRDGAAPVTLEGEMRYVPEDAATFFGYSRDVPLLYLHVDRLELLPAPRKDVNDFRVSVAVSFEGRVEGREGFYVTYDTFDPADAGGLPEACRWIEQFYVSQQYHGRVVTDFDETRRPLRPAVFGPAVFGLPDLLSGKLDLGEVERLLRDWGLHDRPNPLFVTLYQKQVFTEGGPYVEAVQDLRGTVIHEGATVKGVEAGKIVGRPGPGGGPGEDKT
jgi:GNAT superfamily N-acetyltransferase